MWDSDSASVPIWGLSDGPNAELIVVSSSAAGLTVKMAVGSSPVGSGDAVVSSSSALDAGGREVPTITG